MTPSSKRATTRTVNPIKAWAVYQKYKDTFQSAHPSKFEAEVSIYEEVRSNYILKEVEIYPKKKPVERKKD